MFAGQRGTLVMMKQVHRFYLTEFLKTQRYFIPVMVLFLQFHYLSYTEIFILYAVQSLVIFLLEIPSGILADQFGKKACLVFARFILIPAYLLFTFADSFLLFLAAMVLMALNKAFKSGTHKAYIYDYLEQNHPDIPTTEVFGKNKFWARIGEAAASLAGGFIAAGMGYSAVFAVALFPALLNFLNALSYEEIREEQRATGISFRTHFLHLRESLQEIRSNPIVLRLMLNSALFVSSMEAGEKFFQPYMEATRVPLELFGIIYMTIFLITALGSRYIHFLERRWRRRAVINFAGWLGALPLIFLGLFQVSRWGIVMFFLILFLKTVRRPPIITELNRHIGAERRATILSTDSLIEALSTFVLLPAAGLLSDLWSLNTTCLIVGFLLVINQCLFPIRRASSKS